jgi:maltose O-acetyltransferase
MIESKVETEYEKMVRGIYYLSMDAVLVKYRNDAEIYYKQLNNVLNSQLEKRREILNKLVAEFGEGSEISSPFYCDYGINLFIGKNVKIGMNTIILDCNFVRIGDNTVLGSNVQLYTATHPIDPFERNEGKEYAKEILIGSNCHLSTGVIVCPGVKIGNNVVILPGSVVTKSIPDNSRAEGNPCRVIS